ncbi:methyltransferase domain-containing protein [Pedobacter sp. HMF7647]|uniref:Methyltransferase domain-containing protein n=2 Tax=Hufsiella arboris TaxID=2695275 RepID=A0A7K1YDM6_9SPHI|nr:class I SAM-dependent methyltransferase [Hufsiella arboris]MXV52138.1 methyltransferase domain-containing protein [Hufsiella arboris]
MDPFSSALSDFYNKNSQDILWLNNSYGEPEKMPVEVFFREEEDISDLEYYALELSSGRILDVGAGAGCHSLILQQWEADVTALEINKVAAEIMKDRGVKNIRCADFFNYNDEKFDTLLLLMNGVGICGTLKGLSNFLQQAKKLLNVGGQLLFDSSDVSYLKADGSKLSENYFGEISYQYVYKDIAGEWFDWLYVDQNALTAIALQAGWNTEIMYEDEDDQYLARLTLAG